MARRLFGSIITLVSLLFLSQEFLGAQVRPRIVTRPDDGVVVRIPGTTHPAIAVATPAGRAPAGLPMERMLMHLNSSPEQAAALQQLLAEQQDPASPQYHAWLTPAQFGERFGLAQQDLDTIALWLQSQGFQVTEVAPGRRSIEFSGTARQVENAFHTQINRYLWNGERHTANAGDISIPEALAPVVAGVASLHDFRKRAMHHMVRAAGAAPETDLSGGAHGLSPFDFAAIYDVSSLWNSGFDGTGQSIAIVAETNIKLTDVTGFRSLFGLPANSPQVIVNGTNPGILTDGEETEADLDVEWAGAVAKGATIKLVVSASTNASDGITLSAQYIVNHTVAPVMSLSYGACEAQMGGSNSFFNSLWEQAAAEGIAVFVAAGDSGSAGCDLPSSSGASGKNTTKPAGQGFGVNGLGSTPYNVAVGGTMFNDTASPGTYWNSANNSQLASAKGYIPELAWNESSYTTAGASGNGLYAGGGGASIEWPRPSWQSAPGVPSGSMRLVPDVSLSAAGHDGYLVEQEGSLYMVGGTSASTPSFAGLMAIVNQYTNSTNGNPNAKLYSLATKVPSVYHDVTTGTNAVPCAGGSPNCSASAPSTNIGKMNGYSAGAGYDMATGLGSVDAYQLALNWGSTAAAPSIVSLSPNPMAGSAAVQSLTINGAGFTSGGKVTVGAATYQGSQVSFVSSAQLVVSVTVGTAAQTMAVQVTNSNGQASNTVNLTVAAPGAAPTITNLSPNPMTGSAAVQSLTINGTGFTSGGKVTVGAATYLGSQVSFVSSVQLVVGVSVGTAAQTLAVQVTNSNGQASNTVNLTVTAPSTAPTITTLSPNPMTGSAAAQNLTVNGTGFTSGAKVMVGTAIYQGSQVSLVSSSQLVVNVSVGIAAQTLAVQVTNSNGQASNVVNLAVTASALAPVIASVSPNPMTASNSAQLLTINGSGFVAGLRLLIGGTTILSTQLSSLSSSQLTLYVITGLTAYTYPVQVVSSTGVTSNIVNLQVTAPPAPAITSLSPNPLTGSASAQTLTINGSNFQSGTGLKVTVGTSTYSGSQVTFVSASQLKATVTIAAGSKALSVAVTNPSGQVSNTASLTVH